MASPLGRGSGAVFSPHPFGRRLFPVRHPSPTVSPPPLTPHSYRDHARVALPWKEFTTSPFYHVISLETSFHRSPPEGILLDDDYWNHCSLKRPPPPSSSPSQFHGSRSSTHPRPSGAPSRTPPRNPSPKGPLKQVHVPRRGGDGPRGLRRRARGPRPAPLCWPPHGQAAPPERGRLGGTQLWRRSRERSRKRRAARGPGLGGPEREPRPGRGHLALAGRPGGGGAAVGRELQRA